MLFNPVVTRKNAFSPGMLQFLLDRQHNPDAPMGNVGASELGTVLNAWLVGLNTEVAPVIPRSLQWIDKAIADDEKLGIFDHNFHRRTLHWANALGMWMQDGDNVEGEWDDARVYEEAAWRNEKRPWTTHEIVKGDGLDDYMAFAFQGGEHNDGFEAGIDMYERWTGKTDVSLSKPLKPRDFGYALCLQQLARKNFDEEDLFKAGRKMLQENLQENWLGYGQEIRAATWLKIVYWHHDFTLTPLQVVLKAYENMPKVPRPDFVPEV